MSDSSARHIIDATIFALKYDRPNLIKDVVTFLSERGAALVDRQEPTVDRYFSYVEFRNKMDGMGFSETYEVMRQLSNEVYTAFVRSNFAILPIEQRLEARFIHRDNAGAWYSSYEYPRNQTDGARLPDDMIPRLSTFHQKAMLPLDWEASIVQADNEWDIDRFFARMFVINVLENGRNMYAWQSRSISPKVQWIARDNNGVVGYTDKPNFVDGEWEMSGGLAFRLDAEKIAFYPAGLPSYANSLEERPRLVTHVPLNDVNETPKTLYDWNSSSVPTWVNFMATDLKPYGAKRPAVFGYEKRPVLPIERESDDGAWHVTDFGDRFTELSGLAVPNCDWRQSLEERPKTP